MDKSQAEKRVLILLAENMRHVVIVAHNLDWAGQAGNRIAAVVIGQ